MATSRSLQPRKQGKQRRAVQTRARIVDAAAQIFARHGYSAGTTNRIAEAAGVSIGSLYQYFPNKDAILVALVDAHIDTGFAAIQRHLASAPPDAPLDDLLRRLVQATLDNHAGDATLHRVLFEEAPRPPDLLARLRSGEQWLVAAARRILDEHPAVTVDDTETAAHLVVAAIESLVHRHVTAGRPVPDDRLERELVAMLAGYLRGGGRAPG